MVNKKVQSVSNVGCFTDYMKVLTSFLVYFFITVSKKLSRDRYFIFPSGNFLEK